MFTSASLSRYMRLHCTLNDLFLAHERVKGYTQALHACGRIIHRFTTQDAFMCGNPRNVLRSQRGAWVSIDNIGHKFANMFRLQGCHLCSDQISVDQSRFNSLTVVVFISAKPWSVRINFLFDSNLHETAERTCHWLKKIELYRTKFNHFIWAYRLLD